MPPLTTPPRRYPSAVLAAMLSVTQLAHADTPASCDLPRGKDVFQMCSACHSLTARESQREGPTLAGLIGRKAGSLTGFQFSTGMRTAGWDWTPGLLDTFLSNPRKAVRGTTMTFTGLRNAEDRAAVVCYVAQETAANKP